MGTGKQKTTATDIFEQCKPRHALPGIPEIGTTDTAANIAVLYQKTSGHRRRMHRTLLTDNACLLLNGDSSVLPLPDESVDAVVTDPPYFDFIHYSELADFFYAWLAPAIGKDYTYFKDLHSRRDGEVQNRDKEVFAKNLGNVLKEANRVLKKEGVLAFTFHHSRKEGWGAIYQAVHDAGLIIERAYPVKAEMSVSAPKSLSNSPINLDSIIVCKKQKEFTKIMLKKLLRESLSNYQKTVGRYRAISRKLSEADELVIFMTELLACASKHHDQVVDDQGNVVDFGTIMDIALERKDSPRTLLPIREIRSQ